VIVANPLWYERVVARSAKRSKCSMIWYYPDLAIFQPSLRRRDDGKFVIVYPGTLTWHQGVDIAIKAFPTVLKEIPEAELHIFGDGSAKGNLIDLTERLRLTDKVLFHGVVPTSAIVRYMAEADLGLETKRASSGFGNEAAATKVWEFMAVGVPVVASETETMRRFLDGSLVRYFRSEDTDDLAAAIVSVYRDPELRGRLIANGAKYIQENNLGVKGIEYVRLVESLIPAN
jgi:glycosyltransferase involved in cell wall biosynthesis